MDTIRARVGRFLEKYGMDPRGIDIGQGCEVFIKEMESGLEGRESSLKMLPSYIGADAEIPVDKPVIVIDAGGTNLRTAIVRFDSHKRPVVEDFSLHAMPGIKEEVSEEEFFEAIVWHMLPILDKSDKIGFCFSYPTEILPDKDGRLIRLCKEIKAKSVEGRVLGKSLIKTMRRMGLDCDKRIVLLNDTVATLLGGLTANPGRVYDGYIGFILGTGTNTCYIEKNRNIGKLNYPPSDEGSMIVNIESGAYGKAPRGEIDLEFDGKSVNPGEYVFEKMISGGYQGGLLLEAARKAAAEGLFSKCFDERLKSINGLEAREIDDFLSDPCSGGSRLGFCCSEDMREAQSGDRQTLFYLIDAIMERAAKLAAINLFAVIQKTGRGMNPCRPVCVAAEGSTFYKSGLFRGKLDYYVRTYLNETRGIYCEFVRAENATLIGTALAGLQ